MDLDGIADMIEGIAEETESSLLTEQQLAAVPVDFEKTRVGGPELVDGSQSPAYIVDEGVLVKELRQDHGASDWGTGEWPGAQTLEHVELRAKEFRHAHDEYAVGHFDIIAAIVYLLR
eukprot:COSAG02_NODE_167_length_31944_cov_19.552237_17_plen_118_part_00